MDTEAISQHLLQRRSEIQSLIKRDSKNFGSTGATASVRLNQTGRASDYEKRLELRLINEAIDRIRVGDYGTCRECGTPIDPERLAAQPYAGTCKPCARLTAFIPH